MNASAEVSSTAGYVSLSGKNVQWADRVYFYKWKYASVF